MTRLIKINADLVESAADEIYEFALDIKLTRAVDGEWSADEAQAQKEYDDLMLLHGKLCEAMA